MYGEWGPAQSQAYIVVCELTGFVVTRSQHVRMIGVELQTRSKDGNGRIVSDRESGVLD